MTARGPGASPPGPLAVVSLVVSFRCRGCRNRGGALRLMGPAAVDYTTWGRHKAAAVAVADALREVGEGARAARLDWCGRTVEVLRCGDCGTVTYRAALCHDRACPVCSWRRSRREYARLLSAVRRAPHGRWVHVTLTLPAHVSTSLSSGLDLLTAAWGRWCRSQLRGALGWWRRVEITRAPGGWHPHVHVLVLLPEGADLDPARVAAAWGRACRLDRAPLVGIRSWGARVVPRLVRYLTSDDHGAAGLTGPVLSEWLDAVRGRRLIASSGVLAPRAEAVGREHVCRCPRCGGAVVVVGVGVWYPGGYQVAGPWIEAAEVIGGGRLGAPPPRTARLVLPGRDITPGYRTPPEDHPQCGARGGAGGRGGAIRARARGVL